MIHFTKYEHFKIKYFDYFDSKDYLFLILKGYTI